jgi:CRISPR system Cascade subunit CasC
MTEPRFIQIHTLHSYPGTLLNRDDAGLAKRLPFGGVERLRISSQCLKRHWARAESDHSLANVGDSGVAIRSRLLWQEKIAKALFEEGYPEDAVIAAVKEIQAKFYASEEAKKKPAGDTTGLGRSEVMVLGRPEVRFFRKLVRSIVEQADRDPKKAKEIATERLKKSKDEFKNLHALAAGAGIDAAMFGRFVSGDRDARVDAAVHVAHAFSVHEQASEPDYFTAVDDLQAEEQGSGAGHLNTADLTSGVYYGYVAIDVPLLVSNLTGAHRKDWRTADRTLTAKTVEALLHLIAKVTPGAKKGSTAPYDWASLVLVEAGPEQPRTLANAFIEPVRRQPLDAAAADALAKHVAAIDGMYGSEARRWLATRHEVEVAAAEKASFPALTKAVATAVAGAS